MPPACSALALAMSDTTVTTLLIDATISFSNSPARLTRSTPSLTWLFEVVIKVLDVFRRLRGALREAAHLGGHHGEAAARVARAGRFDRRIQGQQVGLPGDLVDTPMMSEICRDNSSIRDIAPIACDTTSPPRLATLRVPVAELSGLLGVLGVLFDGRRDLLHRRRGLLEACGLLLGPLRQVGRGGGYFSGGARDLAGRHRDRADRFLQLRHGAVEVVPDLPVLVGEAFGELERQVAWKA